MDRYLSKRFYSSSKENEYLLGMEISYFVKEYEKKYDSRLKLISLIQIQNQESCQGVFGVTDE